jgi:hypothetical protein
MGLQQICTPAYQNKQGIDGEMDGQERRLGRCLCLVSQFVSDVQVDVVRAEDSDRLMRTEQWLHLASISCELSKHHTVDISWLTMRLTGGHAVGLDRYSLARAQRAKVISQRVCLDSLLLGLGPFPVDQLHTFDKLFKGVCIHNSAACFLVASCKRCAQSLC